MTGFKAGRAEQSGIPLAIFQAAGNLALASGVTIALLLGMVFVVLMALMFIINSNRPLFGLGLAIIATVLFNLIVFFLSPIIMDWIQGGLYHTRWVSIEEVERRSPETVRVLRRVCAQKNIPIPRLGIIDDQNPTAFTYGSLPSSARLVVSAGLFTYLDEDEVATVYAHELGHIVNWDFAVMTVASTLVQIMYLIYITIQEISSKNDNEKAKGAAETAALVAYIFYILGTYLLLYLSRVREYFADHFAAEVTGNPNGLARALVKIAYGIVTQSEADAKPSKLLQGTRALGICDAKSVMTAGTAYQVANEPGAIGRVFLWDIYNPWGNWMELNSTHPLTGKRVRALSTYAEQLGLDTEFDMARVAAEGRRLDKSRLYGTFLVDILLMLGEWIAGLGGLIVAIVLWRQNLVQPSLLLGLPLVLVGVAMLIKRTVMYPSTQNAPRTDVLSLMSDPYASPLRGQPAVLHGKIIGRGDAGYVFGSDLKLQDNTGMMYILYSSRFGPIGNFLFGMSRVQSLIGLSAGVRGWFRRGIASWLDLELAQTESGTKVTSHPAFWLLVTGIFWIIVGIVVIAL